VSRVFFSLLRTLLPFFSFEDTDVGSILDSNELARKRKTGGEHSVFWRLHALHANRARLVFVMLRRLPPSFAVEMQVVLRHTLEGKVGVQHKEAKAKALFAEKCLVVLESCGISATNLNYWLPLFSLCQNLILKDNALERPALRQLRKHFLKRKAGVPGLATLHCADTKAATPDVLVEQLRMASELGIKVTVGARRDFCFSPGALDKLLASSIVSDSPWDVMASSRKHTRPSFLKNSLAAAESRSGESWELLREAVVCVQNVPHGAVKTTAMSACLDARFKSEMDGKMMLSLLTLFSMMPALGLSFVETCSHISELDLTLQGHILRGKWRGRRGLEEE